MMRSLLRLGDGDDSMQIATSNDYPRLDMCTDGVDGIDGTKFMETKWKSALRIYDLLIWRGTQGTQGVALSFQETCVTWLKGATRVRTD